LLTEPSGSKKREFIGNRTELKPAAAISRMSSSVT
jgi:hypothetical protein